MGCRQSVRKFVLIRPNPLAEKFSQVNADLVNKAVVIRNSDNSINSTNTVDAVGAIVSNPNKNNNTMTNSNTSTINTTPDNSNSGQNVIDMAHSFISNMMNDAGKVVDSIENDLGLKSISSISTNSDSTSTTTTPTSSTDNSLGVQNNLSTSINNVKNEANNLVSSLNELKRSNTNSMLGILLIVGGIILAVIASRKDRAYLSMIVATVAVVIGVQMTVKSMKKFNIGS